MDFLRAFHVDTERQKPKSLEADRKAERRGVWGRTDGPRDVTTGPASEQSGPEQRREGRWGQRFSNRGTCLIQP